MHFLFSGLGTLGIGTTNPGNFTGFNNNEVVYGRLRADFDGSIRVARNIYDSAGSVGANANFLSRDGDGIRWVSFTPVETEGVFLQDEGTFVPTVGAAQSFTVLNFVQKNSDGRGTDTLIPTAQDLNDCYWCCNNFHSRLVGSSRNWFRCSDLQTVKGWYKSNKSTISVRCQWWFSCV